MLGLGFALLSCLIGAPPGTPLQNRLIAIGYVQPSDPRSLFFIDPDHPDLTPTSVALSGLESGDTIITIANDPFTGTLYGYSQTRRLYSIDKATGAATQIGSANSSLPGISGAQWFWIRIEPVSGVMRFIHLTHGNYRVDRITNTTIAQDTNLDFGAGDPHFGATDGIISLCFSNAHDAATSTQGFLAVGNQSIFAKLTDPSGGQLTTLGDVGYYLWGNGGLVWDLDGSIYCANNISVVGLAGPQSEFYRIDPASGHGVFLGELGSPPISVYDIAIDYEPNSSDRDRDGFPNAIEDLATTDTRSPSETPFTGVTPAPTKSILPTLANRLRVNLRFDVANKDSLLVKGSFQIGLNEEFERAGMRIIADIGGDLSLFDLNAKGKATASNGAKIQVSKPSALGVVKFQLTRKNASLASTLNDEGLTNTTVSGGSAIIDVDLWMADRRVSQSKTVSYDAVAGVKGKAHE